MAIKTTKPVAKKPKTQRSPRQDRVDYYPNRMTLAVSVLGGVSITILGLLVLLT